MKLGRKKKEKENQAQQTANDLAEAEREEFDDEFHLKVRQQRAAVRTAAHRTARTAPRARRFDVAHAARAPAARVRTAGVCSRGTLWRRRPS